MSLIRSSVIAGVTTGLLGIGAMELADKDSYKQSYFWSATLSTAVVGGIAWAILHNEQVEKTLSLDASGSGEIDISPYDEVREVDVHFRHDHATKDYAWEGEKYRMSDGKTISEDLDDGETDEVIEMVEDIVTESDEDEGYEHFDDSQGLRGLVDWTTWKDDGRVYGLAAEETDFLTLAAEFNSERKPRRRSRLSWARGYDPRYVDASKGMPTSTTLGYDIPMNKQWNPTVKGFAHYHIDFSDSTGAKDYAIHLWKPKKRPSYYHQWKAYAWSPKTKNWTTFSDANKGRLTPKLIKWYNDDIALPESAEVDDFMEYLISTGAIAGGVQLVRQYTPPIRRDWQSHEKQKRGGVTFNMPGITTIWFVGGDHEGTKLLEVWDNETKIRWANEWLNRRPFEVPEELHAFVLRLLFTRKHDDRTDIISQRSINRYNKNQTAWIATDGAWFKNAVKEGIWRCNIQNSSGRGELLPTGKYALVWKINNHSFMRFVSESKWSSPNILGKGPFQIVEPYINDEGLEKYRWFTPRPSTIRKMYDNVNPLHFQNEDEDAIQAELFLQCVQKWQPQQHPRIRQSMLEAVQLRNLSEPVGFGPLGHTVTQAGKMMCRRFKKKF